MTCAATELNTRRVGAKHGPDLDLFSPFPMWSGVAQTNPEAMLSASVAAGALQGSHCSATADVITLVSFFAAQTPVFCLVPVSLEHKHFLKTSKSAVKHQV